MIKRENMKPCRECKQEISEQALACPNCGTPYPAKDKWDGWGFEYRSASILEVDADNW